MPIRVLPANENMVKYLKHPVTKVGFANMGTAVTWPDDTFTARRIRDGDVTVEGAVQKTEEAKSEEVVEKETE